MQTQNENKQRETNSLPAVKGKSLTQLKIESKFFLNFQFNTLVNGTESISPLNPTSNLHFDEQPVSMKSKGLKKWLKHMSYLFLMLFLKPYK